MHKKGPANNVENYRPVANLSSTSKIFERLNSNLILEIEAENCTDITGKSQHGFKKNLSTSMLGIMSRQCMIAQMVERLLCMKVFFLGFQTRTY